MTLLDIINIHEIVNDETRVILNRLQHDPPHYAAGHCCGNWYHDNILKYMNCEAQRFTYNTDNNHLIITIIEEA